MRSVVTTILDPTAERDKAPARELAARSGKPASVVFVDIRKPRGNIFLDELETLLTAQGISVVRSDKPTFTKPAPADVRAEILAQGEAVVEALAD